MSHFQPITGPLKNDADPFYLIQRGLLMIYIGRPTDCWSGRVKAENAGNAASPHNAVFDKNYFWDAPSCGFWNPRRWRVYSQFTWSCHQLNTVKTHQDFKGCYVVEADKSFHVRFSGYSKFSSIGFMFKPMLERGKPWCWFLCSYLKYGQYMP